MVFKIYKKSGGGEKCREYEEKKLIGKNNDAKNVVVLFSRNNLSHLKNNLSGWTSLVHYRGEREQEQERERGSGRGKEKENVIEK